MKVLSRILEAAAMVISIAIILWVFISWFDVILHNSQPGGDFLDWNFFKWLVRWAE